MSVSRLVPGGVTPGTTSGFYDAAAYGVTFGDSAAASTNTAILAALSAAISAAGGGGYLRRAVMEGAHRAVQTAAFITTLGGSDRQQAVTLWRCPLCTVQPYQVRARSGKIVRFLSDAAGTAVLRAVAGGRRLVALPDLAAA